MRRLVWSQMTVATSAAVNHIDIVDERL